MLIRIVLFSTFLFGFGATNVFAQDAAAIAKVQSGTKTCVKCNLFQADLSFKDVSSANFSGARLRQGDLSLATADRTRFDGADLSIVNAFGARFVGASFVNADLSRASFVGAYFGGAKLHGAKLNGANFSGADLSAAAGLAPDQLATACGDDTTRLPAKLKLPKCQ